MDIERLQELRRVIVETPDERVDLNGWARSCGTIACVLGWACKHPPFVAEGLHLFEDEGAYTPCFGNFINYEAGGEFFRLSYPDAEFLFGPRSWGDATGRADITDKQLALQRIDELLGTRRSPYTDCFPCDD